MENNGMICPNCQQDIGYWSIVKAPLANLMKCSHCKMKVTYENYPWLLRTVLVFLFLMIVAPLSDVNFIVHLILAIVIWAFFEFFIIQYLRRKGRLRLKETD